VAEVLDQLSKRHGFVVGEVDRDLRHRGDSLSSAHREELLEKALVSDSVAFEISQAIVT
jgi:hypothetical protein